MSRRTPIMFLDMTKRPGDEDCVMTAEDILAENERLKSEIERMRQPGNVAALREAAEKCRHVIHCAIVSGILKGDDAYDAMKMVSTALSSPARNCDFGTSDEQAKRFEQFCSSVDGLCDKCELDPSGVCPTCGVRWSQWTYKAPSEGRE